MSLIRSVLIVALLAGCGDATARLFVSQDGGSVQVEVGAAADTGRDSGQSDAADVVDVVSDTSPDLQADAVSDVGFPDTEPDTSGLEPACAEIDESLEFGERILGEEHEEIIRVRNCGGFESENLVIESVEFLNDGVVVSSPELSLSGIPDLPFALLPHEAWPFPVRYAPTESGEHSGVVRFITNSPDAATVDVAITASVL